MPRRRPRLRLLVTIVVLALAAMTLVRPFTSSPTVGHWRSVEGRQAYLSAYDEAMRALPAPTATREVPTRYGTVHVAAWTSPDHRGRTPVVLLPGTRSGIPMWAEQVREISRHRDVYAFDAVGDAGRSTQNVPITEHAQQGDWVEDVLAGLGLARVHTVGHSFGGATAMAHARSHPGRVAGLTLLEPAFTLAYPPPAIFLWATVATLPFVPQSWRDHALARIGGVDVSEVRSDDPMGRMIDLATAHYSGHAPTPAPVGEDVLRSLPMPVYVAIADRDSLAGGEKAAEQARLIPGATVQTWPNTTHSLPMQAGPALTDRLESWWSVLK